MIVNCDVILLMKYPLCPSLQIKGKFQRKFFSLSLKEMSEGLSRFRLFKDTGGHKRMFTFAK